MANIDHWVQQQIAPGIHMWRRYIDDIFCICDTGQEINILNSLNSYHPEISFTLELENRSVLPYLDILVIRTASHYHTTVYHKTPCNHQKQLYTSLFHPISRHLPHPQNHGINTHFTNSNSIGAILRHPITRLPRSTVARSSGGSVYSVSCNDCSASYIGETGSQGAVLTKRLGLRRGLGLSRGGFPEDMGYGTPYVVLGCVGKGADGGLNTRNNSRNVRRCGGRYLRPKERTSVCEGDNTVDDRLRRLLVLTPFNDAVLLSDVGGEETKEFNHIGLGYEFGDLTEVLSLGLKYRPPATPDIPRIISGVEPAISSLSHTAQYDIRSSIAHILRKPTLLNPNPLLSPNLLTHKPGIPLRPIIAYHLSPAYKLSKYLTGLLTPWVKASPQSSAIRDIPSFVQSINSLCPVPNTVMVSYDVVAMYLSLPHQLIIRHLTSFLQDNQVDHRTAEAIVALSSLCLDFTTFTFNNQLFKQIRGSPMGSPLSSPLAEIVMANIDHWVQQQIAPGIHMWRRYIDDIFCICDTGQEINILNSLNSYHPEISFTLELENRSVLPYLDILVIRTASHYHTTVYHKINNPTFYTDYKSSCPLSHKINTVHPLQSPETVVYFPFPPNQSPSPASSERTGLTPTLLIAIASAPSSDTLSPDYLDLPLLGPLVARSTQSRVTIAVHLT
ncbi:ACSF2 [Cordylochernes scorpioides]|uniref:ACSF2 n=1 Tax=Cordylochernes scorpioides TaxID=51811 RepID=A0ABY6KKL5_9ARAC|nr:ACSF2 [Cordylochernes scorpioides]